MSLKAVILIVSVIAYIVVNTYFIRTDAAFKQQNQGRKMFSDPLGIRRFRQQPFKMTVLMAILLGPILLYFLTVSNSAG